jgi:xanthine dehydrogenase/oxidase
MDSMLRWFASTQIRNVATLAGNVVTASPISDMAPLLVACGAIIVAEAASGSLLGERRLRLISAQRMFVGYRRTALLPAEIIVAIVFPFERPFEYTFAYKQARRREDDITLVGAAFRVRLHPQTSTPLDGVACRYWGVASMGAAFAGMAPYTAQVPGTLSAMVSEAWCKDTLEAGLSALRLDLPLPDNVPGGTSRDGLVCDESRHCCRCSGSATCLMS